MATLRTTGVLLLFAASASACYTIRVDEGFWLRPRPGAGADIDAIAAVLPTGGATALVDILRPDGSRISGVVARQPGARATVLYLGGDDFRLSTHGARVVAALASAAPVNVVLADYAGTGASEGAPTFDLLLSDAMELRGWICDQPDLARAPVVIQGHSMGSFLATAVAVERQVDGLVLQSAATNIEDWMDVFFRPSRFKWWARPAYPFIRYSVDPALAAQDNLARVRAYRGPLLVLVGADDDITPPWMARALYDASSTPLRLRRLAELPDVGHQDVLESASHAAPFSAFIAEAIDPVATACR